MILLAALLITVIEYFGDYEYLELSYTSMTVANAQRSRAQQEDDVQQLS